LNIKTAAKSSINPHFGSTYAGLKDIIAVSRDALNNEGIAVVFETGFTPERTEAKLDDESSNIVSKTHFPRQDILSLKLILRDQVIASNSALVCAKDNMQSRASAQTYGMRQLLVAALCIATDEPDDDGNSAVTGEKAPAKATNKRSNYSRKPKQETPATTADDFLPQGKA
tara:strand:+ start:6723 stop:7235 length:513 start_codon:yes stop_codon:yes gene_type:complete